MVDLIDRYTLAELVDSNGNVHWEDIKDMPSVQTEERPTGCEYCVTDRDDYIKPIEKNCHAFVNHSSIYGYVIVLKARGWNGHAKIRFCPMCGRALKDER